LESAAHLAKRDKYQFQWWACSLVNAQPYQGKKKGADIGIDGLIYFQDDQSGIDKARSLPRKVVVSVKAGENIGVAMIRDLPTSSIAKRPRWDYSSRSPNQLAP